MTNEFNQESYKTLFKQYNVYGEDIKTDVESDDEYKVGINEIDINDYEFAEDNETTHENLYKDDINIINILTIYYKKNFNITKKVTLFDDINDVEDTTATNKCMEFVYGEIFRFDNSNLEDKDVLYDLDCDVDITLYKEFYCLTINGEVMFMSPFIIPIPGHLAKLDWINIDWSINNLI